jgi:hypothetical protein
VHYVWYLLGERSFITIFDNLDSEIPYIKLLLASGNSIGFDIDGLIQGTMNGVERSFFRSGLNFSFIFFKYFETINAYILNHLTIHLVGYFGMYLLINRHFCDNKILSFFVSICFAFLPYYSIHGISVSGQPILLFTFLNILKRQQRWYDWVIIFIFPFYAFTPFTIPFVLPVLTVMLIKDYYEKKQLNYLFILGGLLFLVSSLIADFPLLYNTFFSKTISHRTEFDLPALHGLQFDKSLNNFLNGLIRGETAVHSGRMNVWPIVFSLLILYLFKRKVNKMIFVLIGFYVMIVFFASFYDYFLIISPLKTLSLDRFYFFSPLIWFLILVYSIRELDFKNKWQTLFLVLFMPLFFFNVIYYNTEIQNNIKIIRHNNLDDPTFGEFIDKDVFNEVKLAIGPEDLEKKNIICIGFYPNLAQYHGIKTLDSYQNNYSLAYKHQFRRIIANELQRKIEIKNYFDLWGSRCYAFSSEIPYFIIHKYRDLKITKLHYDWQAFVEMNGKYVLSALPINFEDADPVKLVKSFVTEQSYRKLYLYEVTPSK